MSFLRPRRWHVFVSHAHEDAAIAETVVDFLEKEGLRCWLDRQQLRIADPYDDRILEGIRGSCLVLALVSRHSIGKDYVRSEVSSALGRGVRVAPLYLERLDASELRPPFDFKAVRVHGLVYDPVQPSSALQALAGDLHRHTCCCRVPALLWLSLLLLLLAGAAFGLDSYFSQKLHGMALTLTERQPPAPTTAAVEKPQLKFDLFGLRKGAPVWQELANDSELASAEHYTIDACPSTSGYLYIADVDSAGKVQWLWPKNKQFPYSEGSNPVLAGAVIHLPADATTGYQLDERVGSEYFVAILSVTPWPELERDIHRLGETHLPLLTMTRIVTRSKGTAGAFAIEVPHLASRKVEGKPLPSASPIAFQARTHWLTLARRIRHVAPSEGN